VKNRWFLLVLVALVAGASGCASTTRREDGSSIFGPRAWANPPAPPQRQVTLTAASTPSAETNGASPREGLSKYFPGLIRKNPGTEAANIAATPRYRPTWFGLRSAKPARPAETTTYVSDAREQLNRAVASPSYLPVALQVPTGRAASDNQVTPTGAEAVYGGGTTASTDSAPALSVNAPIIESAGSNVSVTYLGGKPSSPGTEEASSLPSSAEPTAPTITVGRMPEVPAVDPLMDRAATEKATTNSEEQEPKPASPSPEAVKPTAPISETAQVAPAQSPTVYASPQSAPVRPTAHVHLSPQVKPSPQVQPTSQVKPSPQSETTAKTWKRPCLRRMVRKMWKLGEFADPPTAAPH